MTVTRILGSFGVATLGVLALTACEPGTSSGPLATQPTGTAESTLRQQQLQNIQSGANRGTQNAPVTTVNPGVGGIERAATGGAGSTAAGGVDARSVSPGVGGIQRQGVGAPSTSR